MKKVWLQIFIRKKIPKEGLPCRCLSIIILKFVIEACEKYHTQIFLEECKYVQEKIKFENYVNDNLDSDSDDETKSDNDKIMIMTNMTNNLMKVLIK